MWCRSVSSSPRYWDSMTLLRSAGEKRVTQPQTNEQRHKRACALTARGSISKAMKGLVGGAAQGSADCRKNWTTALIPRSSGSGTHPTDAECVPRARVLIGLWKVQGSAKCHERARPQQNRYRVALSRQTGANAGESLLHCVRLRHSIYIDLGKFIQTMTTYVLLDGKQHYCRR